MTYIMLLPPAFLDDYILHKQIDEKLRRHKNRLVFGTVFDFFKNINNY